MNTKKIKFDKNKYDVDFHKKYYSQFKVALRNEEYNELCELLKSKNMTKVDFVRNAFKELKKK